MFMFTVGSFFNLLSDIASISNLYPKVSSNKRNCFMCNVIE